MRLKVLGCSGGIGGRHMRTTSFLVDGDVLLDAGTGVGDLSLAELSLRGIACWLPPRILRSLSSEIAAPRMYR
jgi:hypothetical protein